MNNTHITEFLNYYITEVNNPKYAVLLKGKWGSGKTYFINEYKKHLELISQKYIYLSLYGVTSYDEVETKILQSLNPKIFNEKSLLAGKIAQAFVDNKVINSFKVLGKFYTKLNSDGKILIFDDLERCSIKITDLLGYINYFVEHQSYKVILIANEEELEKTKKYKKVKEKLIGKTFEFQTNTNLAYESFVKELDSLEILIKYKNLIVKIFNQSSCNNLRLLRQGLFELKRIYEEELNSHKLKDDLINRFITIFFILVFESRGNNFILFQRLKNEEEKYWDKMISNQLIDDLKVDEEKEKKETIYENIFNKYESSLSDDILLEIETWRELIEDSYINQKEVNKQLLDSKYYIDENTKPWKRLWHYMLLDDLSFESTLEDVYNNLKSLEYKDLFQVMLISSTILKLKNKGLVTEDIKNIYTVLKQQIEYLFENNLVDKSLILNKELTLNSHSYSNLGFDVDFDEYQEIKKYIENKLIQGEKKLFAKAYYEIEEILNKNYTEIYSLLSHSNHVRAPYYDKPIFAYIDINKLGELLINSSSDTQYYFGGVFDDRYKHDIFAKKLEEEFDNVYKLKDIIEKESNKRIGKISGYALKRNLVQSFEKAIEDIEKYKGEKDSKTKTKSSL